MATFPLQFPDDPELHCHPISVLPVQLCRHMNAKSTIREPGRSLCIDVAGNIYRQYVTSVTATFPAWPSAHALPPTHRLLRKTKPRLPPAQDGRTTHPDIASTCRPQRHLSQQCSHGSSKQSSVPESSCGPGFLALSLWPLSPLPELTILQGLSGESNRLPPSQAWSAKPHQIREASRTSPKAKPVCQVPDGGCPDSCGLCLHS